MPITRRSLLQASLSAATTALAVDSVAQAAFPSRPVTFVVPAPAGGGLDIIARKLGQALADQWKVSAIIDNKPGGIGTIGTGAVVRAKPDGHSLLVINTPLVQVPWILQVSYDPLKDLVPLARITVSHVMLAVHKSSPVNSLEEFVAMVRAAPGKYSYGSWGAGTSTHLYAHVLCTQAGVDMIHVPYPGAAPMLNALVGEQITAAFVDPASSAVHAASIKLLAVVGANRMPQYPNVPTLTEKGYKSFEELGWTGVFAPAQTPAPVVAKLSADIVRAIKSPELNKFFVDLNMTPNAIGTGEFTELVRKDHATWGQIIKDAKVSNK